MCLPMMVHWCNLANTIEFVLPSAHRVHNLSSKSIGSAVFAQLTAECRWAHWHHLANTTEHVLPLAPPSPHPKWLIDRFSRFCTYDRRMSLYFTMGRPFPLKIAPSHGLPSNTWFPWPTQVLNPNGIYISSAVFAGLTSVTDRPTDRPRYSVGNNRPHLRSMYVVRT